MISEETDVFDFTKPELHMPFPSEDRSDPSENMPAMRARIPDHIARGEISTGVIVVTGGTEYVLDFVRNLPRPNAIVARVVLPHMVMPQFIDALAANVELFRNRYGELPGAPLPNLTVQPSSPNSPSQALGANSLDVWSGSPNLPSGNPATPNSPDGQSNQVGNSSGDQMGGPVKQGHGVSQSPTTDSSSHPEQPSNPPANGSQPGQPGNNQPGVMKRQNPQEVYDDLKLRDEILSGAYANAVMIGHGPYEFSFDFITNFYPQSAVSCRVYLASGHIHRLLESLRASWEQLRPRLNQQFPPNPPPPTQPPSPPRNMG